MRTLIVVVFVATYAGLSRREPVRLPLSRPALATVGAVVALLVALGARLTTVDAALASIELHTLALLFGSMVLAGALDITGFFAEVADSVVRRRLGPLALLYAVTLGSGLLSALLLNDAVCLLAAPLLPVVARRAGLATTPLAFGLAMGANAGSALTLNGNPQNMLVARLGGLDYLDYLRQVGPAALLALALTAAGVHLCFRGRLLAENCEAHSPLEAPALVPHAAGDDHRLGRITLVSLVVMAVANLAHVPLALSALIAASVVLVSAGRRAEAVLARVDGGILLFFAALFVLVHVLDASGYPTAWLQRVHDHSLWALSTVLVVGSQLISNVPLILLLTPWIRSFEQPERSWQLVALLSTLAGNLTLLGSVANVIVLERARLPVGFFRYLRVGAVVCALSIPPAVLAFLLCQR